MLKEFDCIVIGGGIAGISASYFLSSDFRVLVLEMEQLPGYHATGRSAATYTAFWSNKLIRSVALGSREFLVNPPKGFSEVPVAEKKGALYFSELSDADLMSAKYENLQTYIPSLELLRGAAILEKSPMLGEQFLGAAAWEPDAFEIDVHNLLSGYLKGAKENGTIIRLNSKVANLERKLGRWEVTTDEDTFYAATIINAAGAWAGEIGRLAGASDITISPRRRTVITFDAPEAGDITRWPISLEINGKFYFKGDAGRVLATACDETPWHPCDVQPEELDIAITAQEVEKYTRMEVNRVAQSWAGLRTFTPNHQPVVDYDPALSGFVWLVGQGGWGVLTSPALGRCCAGVVSGRGIPSDLMDLGCDAAGLAIDQLKACN